MKAALISGSPSATSKSRTLLEQAQARLQEAGFTTTLVDLNCLPAEALLGRVKDSQVVQATQAVLGADIVAASSPTYRASYTGLLKTFFDLLPPDSLAGKTGLAILTGGGPAHQLAVDHAFRPLFASLGTNAVVGCYAFDAQFQNGPDDALLGRLNEAVNEAIRLAKSRKSWKG